ncbi:hypothetical protein [Shinella sp. M31]|uniref:hypothetical protein n=1 Tax=Shinella sp. M31 TaxID=3368615 RepID=UPI0028D2A652|nr:hypothetical protein [uncultured Shinella sp.]
MKIRVSYKAKSILHLVENWPVQRDGYEVNFRLNGNNVVGIIVEFNVTEDDLPSVEYGEDNSSVAAHISVPEIKKLEHVRPYVRRIQSFLDSMAPTEVDFKSESIEWVPETEKERRDLKLHQFSLASEGTRYDSQIELTYDFIAALTYHAYSAVPQEISLSFVHNGNKDYDDGKYISAFYNYFFSLETQFFPGYSDPKKVKVKLKDSLKIREAIKDLREALEVQRNHDRNQFAKFKKMNDDQLLEHLVDTRGHLHHHAPRGPASWHPDEQDVYMEDAFALKVLSASVANSFILESVYATEKGKEFFQACEAVGAIVCITARGIEVTLSGDERDFEMRMRIPSKNPHPALIESLNNKVREHLSKNKCTPRSYKMYSENGDVVAEYNNFN